MPNSDATSRAEAVPPPPSTDLLDLRYLAEAAEGNVEFIESILHDYLKGTGHQLEELHGALLAQDVEALRRLAHSVKGASASVGAIRVMEAAARLEEQLRAEGMARADQLVFAVTSEFRRLEAHLARNGEAAFLVTSGFAMPAQ